MKKNILSLVALVAALALAMPAQAQLKFGVKAGLNVNNVNIKNMPVNIDEKNRNGFFAGVTADVTVPLIGIGADVSLLYDNKCIGMSAPVATEPIPTGDGIAIAPIATTVSYTTVHKTLHYIDLPINVKYTYGFSSIASVYLATGPQFSWNIGDRHWNLSNVDEGWELQKSEFSWNIGCGATVLSHVRVGYNYNIGLGKTAEFSYLDTAEKTVTGKLKNNTHQISLTYLF